MVTMAEILQSAKTTPNIAQTKDVSFYDPQGEREAKRKRALSEILVKQGNAPMKNETAGGMTVARSPWENMNQAAQKYMGEYQLAQADEREAGLEQRRQQAMQEALSQWGTDPQAAASILGQDPRTSEMAAKILQGEVDYGRQQDRWAQEDALRREQIGVLAQRAASGGNTPAAMQIANKMFALEQAMFDPNASEQERFMAQREYNLLGQAAKTYGFDRGLEVGGMGGYGNMGGGMQGVMSPQSGVSPQDPMPQDDFGSLAPEPSFMPQPLGVQPMQGYGEAVADIAAQKKAAEGRASEVGKRQGENENLYRSMVSRMPQLEGTVERLSKLGQAATYTTTGRAFDVAARELGIDVPDAATARAEYISMVDNEILPLLRDTFGSQFTATEGESLRATLGNPNASPAEKDAVLRSFIRTKMESIDSLRRELGYGGSLPEYTPRSVNIGGRQYNPMGSQPNAQTTQPQGQIAVNPQTGERLINRGKGWEPYNGQ